jgi:hypothetical protein
MRALLRRTGVTRTIFRLKKKTEQYLADRKRHDELDQDPEMRISRERLRQLRGQYRGKRCFIMGNGPSLNKTDLTRLTSEYVFILNRGYLLLPQVGTQNKFLVSVNRHVIEQFADEMKALTMPRFISWHGRQHVPLDERTMYLPAQGGVDFSPNPTLLVYEGSTVTFVAMELAYWMGFQEVVLIGVDHNFTTQGEAHKLVKSEGDDPNHFDPNYFGKGVNWQLPSLDQSEQSYRAAKRVFEAEGRRIVDATVGGKLQVFPKVEYTSLFK